MRPSLIVPAVALLSLAALCTSSTQAGEKPDGPLTFAVNDTVAGKNHEQWSAIYFQWAMGIKKDRNPVTDPNGKFAAEGQGGPVWFLGGNFGGITKRKFSVPAGKPIFSPVLYTFGPPAVVKSEKVMDSAKDMEVTLNGKSLGDMSKQRVFTGAFAFNGPSKDDAVHPIVAGTQTMAAEGYWFMLRPLPPGDHVLRIKGRMEGGFNLSITYELKVEKP